jgi:hypothetical protein
VSSVSSIQELRKRGKIMKNHISIQGIQLAIGEIISIEVNHEKHDFEVVEIIQDQLNRIIYDLVEVSS